MEIVQSQGVQTPASLARALAFVPRPGDVVTLTTPKTGQTWLLARLRKLSLGHGATDRQLAVDPMRSGGDGDSVKWLEHVNAGAGLDDDQPGAFRVFKSHLSAQEMAATIDAAPHAKFITTLRAPHDLGPSLFSHMRAMYAKRVGNGDASAFEAAYAPSDFVLAGQLGAYHENLLVWLSLRHRPNVMLIWFEDMLADPTAALRQLAGFVGVELSSHLEEETLRATSFDRMARSPAFVNVHPGSSKGGYGLGRAQLTAAAAAALDTRWREVVALETGAASYEELYEQVNGRPFPLPRALGC